MCFYTPLRAKEIRDLTHPPDKKKRGAMSASPHFNTLTTSIYNFRHLRVLFFTNKRGAYCAPSLRLSSCCDTPATLVDCTFVERSSMPTPQTITVHFYPLIMGFVDGLHHSYISHITSLHSHDCYQHCYQHHPLYTTSPMLTR